MYAVCNLHACSLAERQSCISLNKKIIVKKHLLSNQLNIHRPNNSELQALRKIKILSPGGVLCKLLKQESFPAPHALFEWPYSIEDRTYNYMLYKTIYMVRHAKGQKTEMRENSQVSPHFSLYCKGVWGFNPRKILKFCIAAGEF